MRVSSARYWRMRSSGREGREGREGRGMGDIDRSRRSNTLAPAEVPCGPGWGGWQRGCHGATEPKPKRSPRRPYPARMRDHAPDVPQFGPPQPVPTPLPQKPHAPLEAGSLRLAPAFRGSSQPGSPSLSLRVPQRPHQAPHVPVIATPFAAHHELRTLHPLLLPFGSLRLSSQTR